MTLSYNTINIAVGCSTWPHSMSDSSRERCKIREVRVNMNRVEISGELQAWFVGQRSIKGTTFCPVRGMRMWCRALLTCEVPWTTVGEEVMARASWAPSQPKSETSFQAQSLIWSMSSLSAMKSIMAQLLNDFGEISCFPTTFQPLSRKFWVLLDQHMF